MRVTTKGRYALRAVVNLAMNYTDKPISIRQIAKDEKLSPEFLEQIFFKLKKSGLISSVRGPGGGFRIEKDLNTISVKDIFDAVGEGLDLTPCTACTDDEEEEAEIACENAETCTTYSVWVDATEKIQKYFDGITLQNVVDKNTKD